MMKLKLASALVLGVALGIGSSQLLQAQAKPPAYLVTELTISDQGKYKGWQERITPLIVKHGGKFLARAGQTSLVTGSSLTEAPKAVTVIQFESLDKAKAWDAAEEVKAARAIDRGATFRSFFVEGTQSN